MINMDSVLLGLKKISGTPEIRLRAARGEGAHLKQGDIFEVVLPKSASKANVMSIGGKPMTLLGAIPTPLLGKNVQMKVVILGLQIALEIVPEKVKNGQQKTMFHEDKSTKFVSPSPTQNADVRKGKKSVSIQAQLSSALPVVVKNEPVFDVVVQKSLGKKAVLEIIQADVPKKQVRAGMPHSMVAEKTSKPEMSRQFTIDGLIKPLQKGNMFSVHIQKTSHAHNPVLLLEPLERKGVLPLSMITQVPKNQLLNAVVHQRLSNGNIVFHWSGQSYETNAPAHIQVGDTLVLKSSSKTKKVSIEVVDVVKNIPHKASQLLRQSIGKGDAIGQVLQNLNPMMSKGGSPAPIANQLGSWVSLMQNFAVTDDLPLDSSRLLHMMKSSGLMHEAQITQLLKDVGSLNQKSNDLHSLQNLKGAMLELDKNVKINANTQVHHQIQQLAEQGVHKIESLQALNLFAMQTVEPQRMEFPILMNGQFSTVQLAFLSSQSQVNQEENSNPDGGDKSFNVLFAIHLSSLGAIRIDTHISEKKVIANIYSEQDTSCAFIQENIKRLSEKLQALGFHEVQIVVASEKKLSAEKNEQFDRLMAGLPIVKGLLDVTG